jgi:hypothetical protein
MQFFIPELFFENRFLKIPKFAKHCMERRPAEPFMLIDHKITKHCPLEKSLSFPKTKKLNFKKSRVALTQKICYKHKKRSS